MRSATRKLFSASIAATSLFINAYSQTDTISRRTYDAMSLKDLLNVKIVSVSKTAESLFFRGIDHIPGKLLLNANISYEPEKGLQLFCAAKNLLNQTTREFFYTDKVPFMLMGGISYQLQ